MELLICCFVDLLIDGAIRISNTLDAKKGRRIYIYIYIYVNSVWQAEGVNASFILGEPLLGRPIGTLRTYTPVLRNDMIHTTQTHTVQIEPRMSS